MSEKKFIEVNVVDIISIIKTDIRKLSIYVVIASVIGLIIAFTTPKIYKSTVILAPEESGGGFAGSVSSLASMIGMDMKFGQTGDALYPEIYPDLLSSTDFLLNLMPVKVTNKDKTLTTDLFTYYEKHQKSALTDYPKIAINYILKKLKPSDPVAKTNTNLNNGPLVLTEKQEDILKGLRDNIDCQVDKKTNVITITVTDQDPYIAATVVDVVKEKLQTAITEYRTKKAKTDLDYMQKLYAEAKADYDKSRQRYAAYADANMELELNVYRLKQEDMENEMQLKYNIYQTLVEQLQLAKAKVQERTPAFTVIQTAQVPIKHSSRPKIVTLIIWAILGLLVRLLMLSWKNKEMFFNFG